MQKRARNPRFAPESLERRLSPSSGGVLTPPTQVGAMPGRSAAAAWPVATSGVKAVSPKIAFDTPKDPPPPPPLGPVRIAMR